MRIRIPFFEENRQTDDRYEDGDKWSIDLGEWVEID